MARAMIPSRDSESAGLGNKLQDKAQGSNRKLTAAMSGALLIDAIESAAARFGDRVALQMYEEHGVRRYTYRETMSLVHRLSQALRDRGMGAGDRVILWSGLTPQWVLAYLGALHNGCVVIPLDVASSPEAVASIIAETKARIVFTVGEKTVQLPMILKNLTASPELVSLDLGHDRDGVRAVTSLFQGPPAGSAAAISGDDVATIFYTSGTTGQPRGVVISHGSLANSVSGLLEYMEGSEADNILALIPPHHIMASVANVFGPLVKGASVTYLQTLNSLELLRILNKARITILPGVPQLFYLIHKRIFEEVRRKGPLTRLLFGITLRACRGVRQATGLNPGRTLFARVNRMLGGHLRLLVSAASYFDPHVIRDFFSLGFTVQQGYALTESGGGGTFTPFFDNCIGSAGRPMPGVQMKLVDVDESGVGEIAIAGPSLMNGYFNDEKATASVMHEGWFHTGDLARVDAKGNYYITGRKKEMIVLSSGKKVHPEEIELHYSKSPVIKEICVLGIAGSSEYASSEQLHAIIVPDFEYLQTQRIVNCRDAIREDVEELSAALPVHKRILSYEIRTDPLPRTTTRKLMRYVVACEVSSSDRDGTPRRSSTYRFVEGDEQLGALESSRQIRELIRRECRFEGDLHLDMNLELDLGVDSLQRIELVAQVEQLLGIGLGDDGVSGFMTIRDLLRLVQEKRNARPPIAARAEGEDRITWKQILSEANSDDAEEKYVLRSSGWTVLGHYLLLRMAYFLSRLLFRLKVQGQENLPRERPFLICPNHQSYLDGVLMAAVLPYSVFRHVFTLGLTTFFSGGIKGAIARAGRVVPIDPDTNVVRATQVSAMGLRAGQNLLVFPEGSMTSDGRLQPFKKGPAILSRELGAPIVPVAIRGSFYAWSKVRNGIRLAPITITFGRPIAVDGYVGLESDREIEYADITRRLRSAIEELMREPVLRQS